MTPELLNSLSNISVVGLLMLIIWGGARRLWVFGWTYEKAEKDAAEWKATALRLAGIAQAAVGGDKP